MRATPWAWTRPRSGVPYGQNRRVVDRVREGDPGPQPESRDGSTAWTSSADPLAAWARAISTRKSSGGFTGGSRARRANLATAAALNNTPGIVVAHTADDGTPIEDFANFVSKSRRLRRRSRKDSVNCVHAHRAVLHGVSGRPGPTVQSTSVNVSEPFRYLDIRARRLRRRRP